MALLFATTWSDPHSLVFYFQVGITLGVVTLSTLLIFPGRADGSEEPPEGATARGNVSPSPSPTTANAKRQRNVDDDEDGAFWNPHRRLNTAIYSFLLGIVAWLWIDAYRADRSTVASLHAVWQAYFPKEAAILRRP